MSWRSGLGLLADLSLTEHRPPAVVGAVAPHGAVTGGVAARADLISEEPVAELGVVAVCVEDRVRQMGFSELAVTHRLFEPPVVGLAGNLADPARHRDGAPVRSEERRVGKECVRKFIFWLSPSHLKKKQLQKFNNL